MNELIYLPYSPWSEKARWALDAHGIVFATPAPAFSTRRPKFSIRLAFWP